MMASNMNGIIVEKNVDKKNTIVGDIITYSIAVINQGELTVRDIVIIDSLAVELEFVEGSIMLGEESLPDANVVSGVCIGSLVPEAMKILTFKVKVVARPTGGCISNDAIAKFECIDIGDGTKKAIDAASNKICIKVDIAKVQVIKTTTEQIVSLEDIITYQVKLINVGTIEARNILFTDIIAAENVLVKDTFMVNGTPANVDIKVIPGVGKEIQAYVGTMEPGDETIITYQIQVMSTNCRGVLENKAFVKFAYNLAGGCCGTIVSEGDELSMSEVQMGLSTFKQLSVDGYLTIPDVKPDIEEMNDMQGTVDIISCHVITTPISRSNEGQRLSGYKLVIKGSINEVVEYTSNTPEQAVHSAHYSVPFSTFVVLPADYVPGSKVEVEGIVEDIYYKVIDIRNIFKNITILVNVKIRTC